MKMEVEPRTSLLLGERKGTVTIAENEVDVPAPALTNTDIYYANQIMDATLNKITFKNQVLEIRRNLFEKNLKKGLLEKNGQKKLGEWIDQQISMAKSASMVSTTLFTPTLQFRRRRRWHEDLLWTISHPTSF